MSKVKSIKVHHNASLDEDAIDKLVDADLTGKSISSLKNGLSLGTNQANRKLIRHVEVPDDYPENDDDWRKDVIQFLQIAAWKGSKRLAGNGMDEMPAYNVPVSTGILIDKIQVMTGQPTSMSLQIHTSMNHSDIAKRIQESKASKSQVVDAQVIVDDKKQT